MGEQPHRIQTGNNVGENMAVGQVVGAAGNTFIESAKKEDGLVNQLFKIGILLAGLLIISISIAVIVFVFSLDLGGIFDTITAPFRSFFNVFDAGISVFTGVASGFGFGKKGGFNYRNTGNTAQTLLGRFIRK